MLSLLLGALTIAPLSVLAEDIIKEADIDLDSIRYNKKDNSAEIRMKIYNEDYVPDKNEMYYATYYFKMDCGQKLFKPLMIEGYNKRDELMLIDYEPRQWQIIQEGSNLEQAYGYACQFQAIPKINKTKNEEL
jgi:hypothetical protein